MLKNDKYTILKIRDHKKIFDAAASGYTTDKYPGRAHCVRLVLDFLDPQPEDVVLDVGCGPGEQLISLAPIIKKGYGIDISDKMIERAAESSSHLKNLHFCAGSANKIPEILHNVSLSKIFTNYALHHLSTEKKAEAIAALSEYLTPGGRLIVGDIMFSDDPGKYQNLFEYAAYGPDCDTPSTVSELEEMFTNAGLSPITRILNPLVGLIIGEKLVEAKYDKEKVEQSEGRY